MKDLLAFVAVIGSAVFAYDLAMHADWNALPWPVATALFAWLWTGARWRLEGSSVRIWKP